METGIKARLRTQLLAARRAVPADVREAEGLSLAQSLASALGTFALGDDGGTVCAYVPVGSEPGSLAMLDALLATGARVLLPVAKTADDGSPLPLLWGEYHPGKLVRAGYGLLEPDGSLLPAQALADAAVVVVPALAVDRRGVRLGRGAGFYDRSLPLRDPTARLIAVIRDDELVDRLPADPHDVPMTHVLTPGRGLVPLALP